MNVSQIQSKPRFVVTAFGDSKRTYNVEGGRGGTGGSSFIDSARF